MDDFITSFIVSVGRNSLLNKFSLTICLITFLVGTQLRVIYACAPTPPVTTPAPSPPVCCQPLIATPSNNTYLSDGIMTFTYSTNTCHAIAIATCSQPTVTPPLELMAGITVNQVNFINFQSGSVSVSLNCNDEEKWQTGNPPLVVSTIECVLSNP